MSLYYVRTVSSSWPQGIFVVLYSLTTFSGNADLLSVQMKSLLCKGATVMPFMSLILSDSYSTIDILISAACHMLMHSSIFPIFWRAFALTNRMPFCKNCSNFCDPVSYLVPCKRSGYLEQFWTTLV